MLKMTLADGTTTYHPAHTLTLPPAYRGGPDIHLSPLEQCDVFQRATSGYHTLAHCGWTLARQGESIQRNELES